MKSILKCIYIILFLILIASSSALFILVATENMQNYHATLTKESKDRESDADKVVLGENFGSADSLSYDNEDLKSSNDNNLQSIDTRENVDGKYVGKEKIEGNLNTDPEKSLNSKEVISHEEIAEVNRVNELHVTTKFNEINNDSSSFEIHNTDSELASNVASNQFDETQINDFTNADEVNTDPPIVRDIPPDKVEQRIIDSGGSNLVKPTSVDGQQWTSQEALIVPEIEVIKKIETLESNMTEEKPIPVFSEWAQKQMEEAEKNLEKNVANDSLMKKNATNGSKATPNLVKLRVKNYASPDCGAKIVTSNSEAQNTGALLTSSKDEYMLSPCTSRIWFVVELCEAIQAKQIDLANFELFSSSPKNFTVAVSNRFPTRDWSNVGHFVADDTRSIQSFDLFPHLFGKYVRVDVHSHYNSEHFCPISLLRVYGTSEFEAFDSENRNPYEEIDEVEDDMDQETPEKQDHNLFKSASDAVMSIVKKAAQVLSKEKPNQIEFMKSNNKNMLCSTPIIDKFECLNCSKITNENVNFLLSCKNMELTQLLGNKFIFSHLIKSDICSDRFQTNISDTRKLFFDSMNKNFSISDGFASNCENSKEINRNNREESIIAEQIIHGNVCFLNENKSYVLSSIDLNYLGAMCHILRHQHLFDSYYVRKMFKLPKEDTSLNLTIDKRLQNRNDPTLIEKSSEEINVDYTNEKKMSQKDSVSIETEINGQNIDTQSAETSSSAENQSESNMSSTESTNTEANSIHVDDSGINEGVNIFNIIHDNSKTIDTSAEAILEDSSQEKINNSNEQKTVYKSEDSIEFGTTAAPPTASSKATKEDETQWENDEKLFNEQLTSDIVLNGNPPVLNLNGMATMQHKSGQHSESVFIRLSNRIKALERNMSLSGQYLEELSRRYKKQVEELQTSFTKTLTAIEDQNRRFTELESTLQKRYDILQTNLDELNVKLHFWMFILMICTIVGLVYIFTSFYSISILRRRQKVLFQALEEPSTSTKSRSKANSSGDKMKRRKSADGVSRAMQNNSSQPSASKKMRRPSEEAMKINGSYKDLMIDQDIDDGCQYQLTHYYCCDDDEEDSIENLNSCEEYDDYNNCETNEFYLKNRNTNNNKKSNVRNRKISICYSKDDQPIIRKANSSHNGNNKLDQTSRDPSKNSKKFLNPSSALSAHCHCKKILSNSYFDDDQEHEAIPEEIIVVDDDTDSIHLSGLDSAYEYIVHNGKHGIGDPCKKSSNNSKGAKPKKTDSTSNKIRRLSSPSFLKSPFNKKPPTESTGWEWIRNGDGSGSGGGGGSGNSSSSSNKNNRKTKNNSALENLGIKNNKEYFKFMKNYSLDIDKNMQLQNDDRKSSSPNSMVSEPNLLFLNKNNFNNSENDDSLRTTNSESSSIQQSIESSGGAAASALTASGERIPAIQIEDVEKSASASKNREINGGMNNGKNSKTKKQRSFKKMFKKVF